MCSNINGVVSGSRELGRSTYANVNDMKELESQVNTKGKRKSRRGRGTCTDACKRHERMIHANTHKQKLRKGEGGGDLLHLFQKRSMTDNSQHLSNNLTHIIILFECRSPRSSIMLKSRR